MKSAIGAACAITLAVALEALAGLAVVRAGAYLTSAFAFHALASAAAGSSLVLLAGRPRGWALGSVTALIAFGAPPFGVLAAAFIAAGARPLRASEDDAEDGAEARRAAAGPEWEDTEDALPGFGSAQPLLPETWIDLLPDALRHGTPSERARAVERLKEVGGPESVRMLRAALRDPDGNVRTLALAALAAVEERVNRDLIAARDEARRTPGSALVHAALGQQYSEYCYLGTLDNVTRRHYLEFAVRCYARALELTRESVPELFLVIGRALLALGRYPVALSFFHRAVQAAPRDPRTYLWRSEVFLRMGALERVREDMARVLALTPAPPLAAVAQYWAEADAEAAGGPGAAPPVASPAPGAPAASPPPSPPPAVGTAAPMPVLTGPLLERELKRVLGALASPAASRRNEAFDRLCTYGNEEAVGIVSRLSEKAEDFVKVLVCRYLGYVGGRLALKKLLALAGSEVEAVRREASLAIDRLDCPDKPELLLQVLSDGSSFARAYACRALGEAGLERAVLPLTECLRDSRMEVREAAVLALARIGDRRAVRPLARIALDPRAELRARVVRAIGELGGRACFGPLARATRDPEPRVRKEALCAIARVGGSRARRCLLEALEFDPKPEIREEAASRLGGFASGRVARALLQAAACDPEPAVRRAASFALDGLLASSSVSPLRRGLRDPDERIRREAARVLGWLADPRAIAALERALAGDPLPGVRAAAAQALGRLAAAEAIREPELQRIAPHVAAALANALDDPDEMVVCAAATALGERIPRQGLQALSQRVDLAMHDRPLPPLLQKALLRVTRDLFPRRPFPHALFRFALDSLRSASGEVRSLAALALGRSGRSEAVEPLLELATRETDASIAKLAQEAAADVVGGDPAPLFAALSKEGSSPEEAQSALGALAALEVRPDLAPVAFRYLLGLGPALAARGVLPEGEPKYFAFFRRRPGVLLDLVAEGLPAKVEAEVARVLRALATAGATLERLEPLRGLLERPDENVRRDAALALGALGDAGAIERLVCLAIERAEAQDGAAAFEAVRRILAPPRKEKPA